MFPIVRILGREITWSEQDQQQLETRALEQILPSDIGVAFAEAIAERTGGAQSKTSLPAVYRAIQVITDIGASLPMEAIGRDGVAIPINPDVLENPDPTQTYNSTMRQIISSLIFRGNAYLWPRTFDNGNVQSIYVLDPDEVSVAWDRARLFPRYAWRDRNMVPNEDIFHISINRFPGSLVGLGPITAARLMLESMSDEARMARQIFAEDATPTGLLKVARQLSKEEAEETQRRWEASHGNRKRPAVVSGGVEFEPLTIKPIDAQFIEQRNFSVQEVGRLFGLDGFFLLVESGGSLTYSTTEQLLRLFLVMTLNPTYLEPIQQTFSRLLPAGQKARFRTDEILVADIKSRYEAYAIGITNEFLDPEEVRKNEGLAPLDAATRSRIAARRSDTEVNIDAGN